MSRIIIHNQSKVLEDQDAIRLVLKVMEDGRISSTKKGKQYCFLTVFSYGVSEEIYQVASELTKTGDKFTVYDT